MTITEQAKSIQASLQDWATNLGGVVAVASDLAHLWKMAWARGDNVRALICYTGEDARGEFALAAATHRVDRHWSVMITRGRGFNANRGDSLTETKGNAQPLFELVEQARDLIRGMQGVSVEAFIDYRGTRNFQMGEIAMDAYQLEFSLAADLPQIIDTPEENIAVDNAI